MNFKRYTITAALPYANGPIHIGQLAGAYIPPDIYVRYLRLKGEDVAFICGSDEHGIAITLQARKENVSPKEIVDRYHILNKNSFERFGINFDIFHRTSSELHHETAQEFFTNLNAKGEFVKETSEQFYDAAEKQFLADRYIIGTCPNCGFDKAYGDQCEKCGTTLSPKELINPRSTISGAEPELRSTTHWYLPMQQYESWLKQWILEDHKDWKKNVYGQCKSWLEQGLHSRAMTRDLDWGVKVPLADAEGKVLYVWLDAPIGYISATKAWAEKKGKDWRPYWQNNDTRLIHFIGKDNIVFHCIIFPIILKAHGEFILPDNVPANEFMNMEGDKISTSRNWAVWLHEYLDEFPGQEDVLRYVLTANMPETKDSEFTWKDFQTRNNNELVGVLGNFVNRALVLTNKYFDGNIPSFDGEADTSLGAGYTWEMLQSEVRKAVSEIEENLEQFRFRDALQAFMGIARLGNKFLADTEPWKMDKEDRSAIGNILHIALQITATLGIVGEPFLPIKMNRVRKMLNLQLQSGSWNKVADMNLAVPRTHITDVAHLFEPIPDEVVDRQIEKLTSQKPKNIQSKDMDSKPEISFDDFSKMDLRVGVIRAAERVPDADKLLKLSVDVGGEMRTVVSGIAAHFDPENLNGKQVTILMNLAARRIRGVESQGMILMAENQDGSLIFIGPEDHADPGSQIS